MSRSSLVLCRYLVPVRPQGRVLEHQGVLIEEGKIAAILPSELALSTYPHAQVVELPRHVLLPGLINAHTHSPMTLMRGYADDLNMQEWLKDHIWPAESVLVDRDFVRDGTQLAVAEMIRCGTTCFNEQYFFPDEIARVCEETGIRAVIGVPILEQPTCWAQDFDEYLDKGLAVREEFSKSERITFSLAPHAPYSVSDEGLKRIARVASETGMRINLHCLETDFDVKHSISAYGVRPLDRLTGLGLLNEQLITVHMTQLTNDDCRQMEKSGAHVVHCPQSNLKLASGFCPVTELLDNGVNVCIGTDGAASNNNLDLLEEARFASLLAKGVSGDATAVNAMQTLEMMTINGAMALGMEDRLGTIEPGKQADLCAMDLSAVHTVPMHNIVSQIAYAASSSQFSDVWVNGRQLMKDSRLLTLNEKDILSTADSWRLRMSEITEPGKVVT
ncbi:MAG TPA: TRZ/ATZ family hydrolase [Xanthomonadales bacterium]|nr:TRZ/ATZ family hydrolase [Xanthomonadales bacterium]